MKETKTARRVREAREGLALANQSGSLSEVAAAQQVLRDAVRAFDRAQAAPSRAQVYRDLGLTRVVGVMKAVIAVLVLVIMAVFVIGLLQGHVGGGLVGLGLAAGVLFSLCRGRGR